MTDAQLLNYWYIGLGITALVVVIAAVLILLILYTARQIEAGAAVGLSVVKQIRENTQVIWALQDTNQVAHNLADGAQSILTHAGAIAQALHEADVRNGRASA
jgi:hypothetical protein